MNTNALKVYISFLSTGGIDYEASCKKLIDDLQQYEASLKATTSKVEDAILSVFDTYRGANLNKDALTTFTMQTLGAGPLDYAIYKEAIDAVLKQDTGDRESGKSFGMRKGVGGGFWLWADKPESTSDATK